MRGERKIKKLAGKTIEQIIANEYHLIIKFKDGVVLHYHLRGNNLNYVEIYDEKGGIPKWRRKYIESSGNAPHDTADPVPTDTRT